jgi:phenylalanyl-tRNA synthetase beta chain
VKVLVSWLRDFVEVTAPPEELGHRLSMVGFELSEVVRRGTDESATDAVLDFEITANRPDCLSILGLAREAATAYQLPLRVRAPKPLPVGTTDVTVALDATDLCPRYSAAVFDVTIAPSPVWLSERLQACGIRPINNVVDVTNYVLLEIGQPTHAFDITRLAGASLRVRRAAQGERITTLDGVDRPLDPEMLVIADAHKAQAVAGVMGGGLSEVSDSTTTIVLESACFLPKSVRVTSKRLGLKTEASARFERGTDVNACVAAIERAAALFEQIGAGQLRGGIIDEYPSPAAVKPIALRASHIERLLGQAIASTEVERMLSSLGFGVTSLGSANTWNVTPPTFRVDVTREADLIEEVGRHHGYDKLPSTFPVLEAPPPAPEPKLERDRTVRRVLLAAGCSEAVTFSFIAPEAAAPFAIEGALVPISNPLTTQFAMLRPSLIPGLLAALAHNRHRQRADVRLFEVGAVVTRAGQFHHAGIIWAGEAGAAHWSGKPRSVDFFDVKGIVELVADALQVRVSFDAETNVPFLTPGRSAWIMAGGRHVGCAGLLAHNSDVYVAELDLDSLAASSSDTERAPITFTPLPRHPSVARDISILIDQGLPADSVRGTIRSVAPPTLVYVREFDRYQGKGVPEGRVSLSLRLTFQSRERTLTDAEVDAAMKQIVAALHTAHNAVQR